MTVQCNFWQKVFQCFFHLLTKYDLLQFYFFTNSSMKFALSILLPSYRGSCHTWEQPLFSTSPAFLSRGLLFPSAGCQGEAHLLAWPPNRCLPASLPPFSFSQSITCQGLAVAAPAVHCLTLLLLQSFLAASSEVPLPAALLCCLPAASSSCLQLSSLPPASPPLGLRAASSSRPCQLLYSPFLRLLPLLSSPDLPLALASRVSFQRPHPPWPGVLLTSGTTSLGSQCAYVQRIGHFWKVSIFFPLLYLTRHQPSNPVPTPLARKGGV